MKQNVCGDGGDGSRTPKNNSRHFKKTAGGKNLTHGCILFLLHSVHHLLSHTHL